MKRLKQAKIRGLLLIIGNLMQEEIETHTIGLVGSVDNCANVFFTMLESVLSGYGRWLGDIDWC